jgi:hypothetical protein
MLDERERREALARRLESLKIDVIGLQPRIEVIERRLGS